MKENYSVSDYLNELSDIILKQMNDLIDLEVKKIEKGERLTDLDLTIISKLLLLSRKI